MQAATGHVGRFVFLSGTFLALAAAARAGGAPAVVWQQGACCDEARQLCTQESTAEECAGRYGGDGAACSDFSPACDCAEEAVCPQCASTVAPVGETYEVRLADVRFTGPNTTFTYQLCRAPESRQLSHWVLGLSPDCCARICTLKACGVAGTSGGTSTGQCALDPTTGLFGLKFETPDGVPLCSQQNCGETDDPSGAQQFSVTLQGRIAQACVKIAAKGGDAAFTGFTCVQGPDCDPCSVFTTVCPGGDPDCDDCNLNGVPDACDIALGVLADDDGDGVPDSCVHPVTTGENWSDDIWGLTGLNPYPDNLVGVPDLHVSLLGTIIRLDVNAQVETLRLLFGGTLTVTEELLGDLEVVDFGGVFNEGSLLIGNDRTIRVPVGPLLIGAGGRYAAAPQESRSESSGVSPDSGTLSAASITLLPTFCGETDQFSLTGFMTAFTSGDFVMDGRETEPCPFAVGHTVADVDAGTTHRDIESRAAVGGQTPPVLRLSAVAPAFRASSSGAAGNEFIRLTVGGSFTILHAAEVCLGCAVRQGELVPAVMLHGDFENSSLFPSLFDGSGGSLHLAGDALQTFEVAGLDLGPVSEGFQTDVDALFDPSTHGNFSLGRLTISNASGVSFVNDVLNTAGAGPCDEALYVDELILEKGADVTLENVRIYYNTLLDHGATVRTVGCCGGLVSIVNPPALFPDTIPTIDGELVTATQNRYLALAFPPEGARSGGELYAVRVTFTDLPGPLQPLEGTQLWLGPPQLLSSFAGRSFDDPVPADDPDFVRVAALQCHPHFADWAARLCRGGTNNAMDCSSLPDEQACAAAGGTCVSGRVIHAHHDLMVPGGAFTAQLVRAGCEPDVPDVFGDPLPMATSVHGDVAGFFSTGESLWTAPDSKVLVSTDVLAVIDAILGPPKAPVKTRADLIGFDSNTVDGAVRIGDALRVIDAALGKPYPFPEFQVPCQ